MANWPPLVLYGLRPYPAFIQPFGQLSTSPTPRPLPLFLGLGGPYNLLGAYGPSSHLQTSWPNPFYYGGLGHLGPFWPESNEAKRGQGGRSSAPKARWVSNHKWAHLSHIWSQIPSNPRWP
ncbi:hypothetical protein O181_103359 [Austropuccinia psidii MF-1]|uniref:Uncharacterized protein n=1 Tax=Austropuccinia psidii MF-1 TaxID=1389203 RepID=A0A9Q3PJ60_9BASI|nr:hypothetical protein [Austropuccinia psidii MF-1]